MSDQNDASLQSLGSIPAKAKEISISDFDFEIVPYPILYDAAPFKKEN